MILRFWWWGIGYRDNGTILLLAQAMMFLWSCPVLHYLQIFVKFHLFLFSTAICSTRSVEVGSSMHYYFQQFLRFLALNVRGQVCRCQFIPVTIASRVFSKKCHSDKTDLSAVRFVFHCFAWFQSLFRIEVVQRHRRDHTKKAWIILTELSIEDSRQHAIHHVRLLQVLN